MIAIVLAKGSRWVAGYTVHQHALVDLCFAARLEGPVQRVLYNLTPVERIVKTEMTAVEIGATSPAANGRFGVLYNLWYQQPCVQR